MQTKSKMESKKKFKKEIDYIKFLERERIIMIICFFMISFCCFVLIYYSCKNMYVHTKDYNKKINYSTKISFENMSERQIAYAKEIINSIKPEYINMQKYITFKNGELYNKEKNKTVWGINNNKGNITIRYTGDIWFDIGTLKHEMSHTFVETGNRELNEWIAQDVETSNWMEK